MRQSCSLKQVSDLDSRLCASPSFTSLVTSARPAFKNAADAGATAVIQPGGSMRDAEVIAAADERNVAMVLTGVRHFRH